MFWNIVNERYFLEPKTREHRKFKLIFMNEIYGPHSGEYGLLRRVVWYKFVDVSEVLAASIIRVMNALSC
jgi:hypothetical protein